MSNPSLKEQLKALSLGSAPDAVPAGKKEQSKPKKVAVKSAKQKPAWLEHAQYGVELLKAHFPACFKELKDIQPLKVGIKQDLVKHLGAREDIVIGDKSCMVNSLAYYVNSIAYHKSMIEGVTRIGLEGEPAGVVTAEEAKYSTECRQAKMHKKTQTSAPVAVRTQVDDN